MRDGERDAHEAPAREARARREAPCQAAPQASPQAPARQAQAERVTVAARAADDASDTRELETGIASGISSLAGLLGLSFLGARNKRREKEQPAEKTQDEWNTIRVVLQNSR